VSNQIPAAKHSNIETNSPAELVNPEEQQVEIKKRRIATAVAKAKAKKTAEKEAISKEDKSS
jgi:electron transport complex protein RnfC